MKVSIHELRTIIAEELWGRNGVPKTYVIYINSMTGDRLKVFERDGAYSAVHLSSGNHPVGEPFGSWESQSAAQKYIESKPNWKVRR